MVVADFANRPSPSNAWAGVNKKTDFCGFFCGFGYDEIKPGQVPAGGAEEREIPRARFG